MKNEIREKLESMRENYEKLSQDDISNIGWKELEKIKIAGKEYTPAVWSEEYDDKLLLVVQLQRKLFLPFIKETECIGSLISSGGQIEHVNEEFLMNEIGHP